MTIDELYHHGILGQKWGKRNGPPYPLSEKAHSSSEKKAGWKKSLNVESGNLATKMAIKTIKKVGKSAGSNVSYRSEINKNVKEGEKTSIEKIQGRHSEAQDLAKINPDFSPDKPGTMMNCAMCSTAYEMRRRGYDVEANTTKKGRYTKDIAAQFGLESKDVSKSNKFIKMEETLMSQPDGARGLMFCGVGRLDGKHSMVWEKQNGNVKILDAQSNMVYPSLRKSIINYKSDYKYEWFRTDNIPDSQINTTAIRDSIVPARKEG